MGLVWEDGFIVLACILAYSMVGILTLIFHVYVDKDLRSMLLSSESTGFTWLMVVAWPLLLLTWLWDLAVAVFKFPHRLLQGLAQRVDEAKRENEERERLARANERSYRGDK